MNKDKSTETKKAEVIIGYDVSAVDWCSPSFLGCQICASASADQGEVTLKLSLKTPFGSISKSFSFSTDINFTWQPFSKFKMTISITNLTDNNGALSFDLDLKPCVDLPIMGWNCYDYSHHFIIPLPLETKELEQKFSDLLMVMYTSGATTGTSSGTNMLQGDIYNEHAKSGFPTIPVVSCLTTCTGVSPICLSNQGQTEAQAGFPTVPVISCVTTCTGVSPICLSNQGQTDAQAGFPTIPLVSCVTTCTGVSPICLSNQGQTDAQVGFPTIPVVSCVTICTGISPICLSNQGSTDAQVGFPTIPVVSCVPCTGIPVICLAK